MTVRNVLGYQILGNWIFHINVKMNYQKTMFLFYAWIRYCSIYHQGGSLLWFSSQIIRLLRVMCNYIWCDIYECNFATTHKSWLMTIVDSICIIIRHFTFIWRNVEWWLRRRVYKSKYAQNYIHLQTFLKMPWDVKGKKTHEMRIVHNNSLLLRATLSVYTYLYIFYLKDTFSK